MEVNHETESLYKSLLGTYIPVRYPMFSVKLLLLLMTSFLFLSDLETARLTVLALCVVLNGVFLRKRALMLGKFLLVSTGVLLVIWCMVVRPAGGRFGLESCVRTLRSAQLHHALTRLWGLFAIGQLFVGCTTQHEILVFLRRIRAPYTISMFVILVGNALTCFIQLYQQIAEGLQMRSQVANPVSRVYYILTSLILNALTLVSGCRKVDLLYEERIRQGIMRVNVLCEGETPPQMLQCCFENVQYPDCPAPVIRRAELSAGCGDIILLTGANGCGKTTLLNLICGIIPEVISAAFQGQARCGDGDLGKKVGMVFQSIENELFFDTAQMQLNHLRPQVRDYWLNRFGLSYGEIWNRSVMDLSSGEQQRLALMAELLDKNHCVCVLDEPTAFLDETGKEIFRQMLFRVKDEKIIIIVSHDVFCKQLANRHVMIRDGLLEDGCWVNDISPQMFPRDYEGRTYQVELSEGAVLKRLSLTRGSLVSVTGPNGAGKTTLAKQVFHRLKDHPDKPICAMMMQHSDHQLYESSILRELLLGGPKDDAAVRRATAYLEQVGLEAFADQPAQFLSSGQKRILVVLCMLMRRPDIIILDEPFSSIDFHHAHQLLQILREYFIEYHPAVLICDQANSVTVQMCGERIVLNGRGG